MTQHVAQILDEVEQLSPEEQLQVRRLICERIPPSGDLTDDDFAALAAASFRSLDEEEAALEARSKVNTQATDQEGTRDA
jgi:hypothetical protein